MGCYCCTAAGRALAAAQEDIARLTAELELERGVRDADEPKALAHARRTIDEQRRQLQALRSAHREVVAQMTMAADELAPAFRGLA